MPAPQPPVDPNVKLPPGVAKQAAAAEAIHAQAYQHQPDPAPQPQPQPALAPAAPVPPAPQPAPPQAHQPEPPAPVQPQPAPQPQVGDRAPSAEELTPEQWRHRYLSMEGRYKQAATSLGGMQEQMAELGDELMRTQDALQQARSGRGPAPQPQPQPQPRLGAGAPAGLTQEEIQAYGPELVDVIQRAARAAIMPDMQNLQSGVNQVGQQVQQVSQQTLYGTLDEQVPGWRTINVDPRFKAWCSLPDLYSGQLRGRLLNAAFKSGHAARVTAFFKGFLAEEQATGQLPDPSIQPAPQPPRQPTIPLEMLTAPGRAKPATGDNAPGAPSEKPIFTRNQIQAFYSAVRQGVYAGREPEKAATEQAIFLAQKEGRVR